MATLDTKCPITHTLITELQDPVQAQDGHVYERSALLEWIRIKGTSPVRPDLHLEHRAVVAAPTLFGLLGTHPAQPPLPPPKQKAVGQAIIAVLDISGSMGAAAAGYSSDGTKETHGLSNLDVAKHAIRTCGHCLRSCEGLLEVHVFSDRAKNLFSHEPHG